MMARMIRPERLALRVDQGQGSKGAARDPCASQPPLLELGHQVK